MGEPVEPIRSAIDPQSESYRANYSAMSEAVDRLRIELKRSTVGGGEKYVQRHLERGKLLRVPAVDCTRGQQRVRAEHGLLLATQAGSSLKIGQYRQTETGHQRDANAQNGHLRAQRSLAEK